MADWHPKLWLQFLKGWQHDGVSQDLLDEYVSLHNPLLPHWVHGNAFGHESETLRLAIYLSLNRDSLRKFKAKNIGVTKHMSRKTQVELEPSQCVPYQFRLSVDVG